VIAVVVSHSQGFVASPSAESIGSRHRDSSDGQQPNRGRRLLLIGAATVALGGGGVLAASRQWRRPGPVPSQLTLATGPRGAVYVEVGDDIARAVQAFSPATHVTVRSTAATVENLRLLARGEVDLGFVSLDAAMIDPLVRQQILTALTRVYDSCLHLVVPAESRIRNLRDLAGARISIGGDGSGTEFTVNRLLSLTGVTPAQILRLGQSPSMTALQSGIIDAAFSLTGSPTPAIAALATRRPLRLVPLGEYFGELDRSIPRAYAPAPIPEGTYRDVKATDTVLVPNILLARSDLSDIAVTVVMSALFADSSKRFWVHPGSRRMSRDLATVTGGAALHGAARAWLDNHADD
jgi:TRAP transporter TAXI family solute receptor